MSELRQRLKHMLLGWGTVGFIYSLCDRLQGEGYRLSPLWFDSVIPFRLMRCGSTCHFF